MIMNLERLAKWTIRFLSVPSKCGRLEQHFLKLDKRSLPNTCYVHSQKRISKTSPCQIQCRRYFSYYDRHKDEISVKDSATSHKKCGTDMEKLAREVIATSCKYDVMAASLRPRSVENLLQELSQFGFPEKSAVSLLSGRLWLLQDPQAVLGIAETLAYYGFDWQVILKLLKSLPSQYCSQESPLGEISGLIEASLAHMRSLGFAGPALTQIVTRNPCILLVEHKKLTSTMMKLKGLFTSLDAIEVSITCPNVFFKPWKETHAIFDYAFFNMGYSQAQIVRSQVLSCPLEYLQDRHVFLKRVGAFFEVKKKDDPRLNPNPLLRHVVNLSDAAFAQRYGGISREEFVTFIAMRVLEREEEENLSSQTNNIDLSTDSSFEL